MIQRNRKRDHITGYVSHGAAVLSRAQYRQFLEKYFIQYLVISSPDIQHVWQLKQIISNK